MNSGYHISFKDFNLTESQFDHHSRLHGIMHTYRVMIHVLNLGTLSGKINEARNAFFAAYIHDMSRKHDGFCMQHGPDAADKKLPLYKNLFLQNGATIHDLFIIGKATAMHSKGNELPAEEPDWLTVALLKDADALDRIRLGEGDLDSSYLRLPETKSCIEFSRKLYYSSVNESNVDFEFMLRLYTKIANKIPG